MKFEIHNRWTRNVKFTAEIDCDENASRRIKIGLAVKWAVKTDAFLTRAFLTGAVLTVADLTDADLTRAVLTGAVLTDAVLTGAVLTGADLTDADLTRAVLTRAVLTGAVLTDAVLTRADLADIRNDLWDVLLRSIPEVPTLLTTLRNGKINGSAYEGDCACLAGTIAKTRGCSARELGFASSSRPIERWFLAIKPGQTPETHAVAKITEAWIIEFMHFAGISAGTEL